MAIDPQPLPPELPPGPGHPARGGACTNRPGADSKPAVSDLRQPRGLQAG